MMVRLFAWYSGRTVRERRLLLLMLATAVPLLAWLLLIRPLDRAYDKALARHLEAVDRNGRVRLLTQAPRGPAQAALPANADLGLIVAESAARAGLALDDNSPAGRDSVSVTVAQARPGAALQWLHDFERQGIGVADLRMTPAGDGTIALTALLLRTPA